MYQRLITRYPGGKSKYTSLIAGECRFDSVVEPFSGSIAFSLQMHQSGMVDMFSLADNDPTIKAIYDCWLGNKQERVLDSKMEYMGFSRTDLGKMTTMQKGQKSVSKNIEALWSLDK